MDMYKMAEEAALHACGTGEDAWMCRQELWPDLFSWAKNRTKAEREKSVVLKSRTIKDMARETGGLPPREAPEKREPVEKGQFYIGPAARRLHTPVVKSVARAGLRASPRRAMTARKPLSVSQAARLSNIYFMHELKPVKPKARIQHKPLL